MALTMLQVVENLLQHLLPHVHKEDLDLSAGIYADDKVSYEVRSMPTALVNRSG